jgi:5-methylcytosine-specific restriction protein A
MPLHETLRTIITDYPQAKGQPFAGHPLGAFIRQEAANAVEGALGELGAGLLVEGSAGAGNWAAVTWISVFDPAITTSATRGYYVVYLFHVNDPVVHLSLNQGTTAVREEFRNRAREILQDRADLMRKRVAEFADALPINKMILDQSPDYQVIMQPATHWESPMSSPICLTKQNYARICRTWSVLTEP